MSNFKISVCNERYFSSKGGSWINKPLELGIFINMERVFSSTTFRPEIIFGGLTGNIIDYIISSYMLDMNLVRIHYWHPAIHCYAENVYNAIPEDESYYTELSSSTIDGKYHAKFVLITTDTMLRFIIMSTNITKQLIENNTNDYYVFDSPRIGKLETSHNCQLLQRYLRTFKIQIKESLNNYQWKHMHANFLVSIPNIMTHTECWRSLFKQCPKGRAVIQCPSGSLNYDIHESLGVQQILFKLPNEFQTDPRLNYFLIDGYPNYQNKWLTLERFPLELPYHFKRYEIWTLHPKQHWRILTSANMSRAAWGTKQYTCKNVEFGVCWNCIYISQSWN